MNERSLGHKMGLAEGKTRLMRASAPLQHTILEE